jgi:hypothetical protein
MLKKISLVVLILGLSAQLSAQQKADIPFHNLYVNNPNYGSMPNFNLSGEDMQAAENGKKSVGKAVLLSLLIPGAGEWYMGAKGQAKVFFGVEILLWGGLFANKWYVRSLEDDYKTYAVQYASIDRAGKDDYYWVNIGKYDDIYDYNTQRARVRYFDEIYTDTEKYYWSWQSKSNRITYDGKRLDTEDVNNNEVYFYSAIVLNHFVSAINAIRLARKHNKTLSWRVDVDAYAEAGHSYYYGLSFSKHF